MALKKVMAPVVSEDTEGIDGKVSNEKQKKGLFLDESEWEILCLSEEGELKQSLFFSGKPLFKFVIWIKKCAF